MRTLHKQRGTDTLFAIRMEAIQYLLTILLIIIMLSIMLMGFL